MPTVAEEIVQLAQLHRQGILTTDEFNQLKEATIRRHVVASSPSAVQQQHQQATPPAPSSACPQAPPMSTSSHTAAALCQETRTDPDLSQCCLSTITTISTHATRSSMGNSAGNAHPDDHDNVSANYTNDHPVSRQNNNDYRSVDEGELRRDAVVHSARMQEQNILAVGNSDHPPRAHVHPVGYDAAERESRAVELRFPHVSLRSLLASAEHTPTLVFETALRHVEQIVQNLLHHPYEPRYRRLRMTNRRLQSELFAVRGCQEVLEGVGFVRATEPVAAPFSPAILPSATPATVSAPAANVVNAAEARGEASFMADGVEDVPVEAQSTHRCTENVLVIPSHLSLSVPVLQETLLAVAHIRKLDVAQRSRRAAVRRLRQDIVLGIRCERARRAQAENRLLDWLIGEYTVDEAGDALHTARNNAMTLEEVIGKAQSHPHCALFHRLRLRNLAVYRAFVQQRGGLEALLVLARGELRGGAARANPRDAVANDTDSAKMRCPSETSQPDEREASACTTPATQIDHGSSALDEEEDEYVWLPMPAGNDDDNNSTAIDCGLTEALSIARALRVAVEEEKQRRAQAHRLRAEAAMRVELRRARANAEAEAAAAAAECAARRSCAMRGLHGPRDSDTSSGSESSVRSRGSKRYRCRSSSDSDNDTRNGAMNKPQRMGVGGGGGARATSGRRVPIAQALAILMGRRRYLDDEDDARRNRI